MTDDYLAARGDHLGGGDRREVARLGREDIKVAPLCTDCPADRGGNMWELGEAAKRARWGHRFRVWFPYSGLAKLGNWQGLLHLCREMA